MVTVSASSRIRTYNLLIKSQLLCPVELWKRYNEVALRGFEPRFAGSKPAVLPLDERAKVGSQSHVYIKDGIPSLVTIMLNRALSTQVPRMGIEPIVT